MSQIAAEDGGASLSGGGCFSGIAELGGDLLGEQEMEEEKEEIEHGFDDGGLYCSWGIGYSSIIMIVVVVESCRAVEEMDEPMSFSFFSTSSSSSGVEAEKEE